MRKSLITFIGVLSLVLSSCSTVRETSTSISIPTSITSESTAELDVDYNKVTYKFVPDRPVRRGGEESVIKAAVSEALKANGNADVMVAMQYEIKVKTGFFGQKTIKYVIVKGYPAKYKNIRPVDPPKYVIMDGCGQVVPCGLPPKPAK